MEKIVLAFIGSYCPGILFNIERKNLIWAGLCGTIGWIANDTILKLTGSSVLGVFAAAMVISLTSELMAKVFKTPSTVFYIPSLFSIVPGISAYYTVLYIIDKRYVEAAYKGLETMASAGAIAFGILLVSTIFRYLNRKHSLKSHIKSQ